jgi:hypothetical protein
VCKGSQSIWVVDHPEAYGQWAYQEADGLPKDQLTTTLAHATEAFGHSNRAIMSAALQLARKISMDVCIKLSNDDPRTRRKIGTWFLAAHASDAEIDAIRAKLVDGFKQISALCNSNTVIFSDRPANRANPRFATAKASVNAGDFMPVIYIYRAFLRYGRRNDDGVRDQLWQCAKTIIHEMTHKLLDTADFRYANRGIRPGGALAVADAIDNADSWGIFALDVVGALPKDLARRAFQ